VNNGPKSLTTTCKRPLKAFNLKEEGGEETKKIKWKAHKQKGTLEAV